MTERSDIREHLFLKACEAWNCAKVKEYLDKGVDVNLKEGGNFALKHAAGPRKNKGGKRRSGLQLLELLLDCPKIDVNIKINLTRSNPNRKEKRARIH